MNDEVRLQFNRLFDDLDAWKHSGDDPRDYGVSRTNLDRIHRLRKGSLGYLGDKQVHDLAYGPGFLEGASPGRKGIRKEARTKEGSRLQEELTARRS